MSRIIYVKQTMEEGNDQGNKPKENIVYELSKLKPLDRNEDGTPLDQGENDRYAESIVHSLRCLKFRPDGKHLACGDWTGNIRIFDLESKTLDELQLIEAHDKEISCLDFSPTINEKQENQESPAKENNYWLASGSRDRLIQIFDSQQSYEAVTVLDNHSSTITSVKFNEEFYTYQKNPSSMVQHMRGIHLLSCGADRALVKCSIDIEKV
jgi:WD40 repeat protein